MIDLVEIDLADPDATHREAAAGDVLVLVRDGDAVVGEVRRRGLGPSDRDALSRQFAAMRYARTTLRVASEASGVSPVEVSIAVRATGRPGVAEGCRRALADLDPAPGDGGPVVAFVDDDMRPDRRFVGAVADGFSTRSIAAVVGPVLPAELASPAQLLFEQAYGRRRLGFDRRILDPGVIGRDVFALTTPVVVTVRREVGDEVAAAAPGEGPLLAALLDAGHVVLYEPSAFVRRVFPRRRQELLDEVRARRDVERLLRARADRSPRDRLVAVHRRARQVAGLVRHRDRLRLDALLTELGVDRA